MEVLKHLGLASPEIMKAAMKRKSSGTKGSGPKDPHTPKRPRKIKRLDDISFADTDLNLDHPPVSIFWLGSHLLPPSCAGRDLEHGAGPC